MNLKQDQPIGIFDSGVGGLTVASAIKKVLPAENMIYFGDTFHLPYGDKSRETVIYYSIKISEFLLEKGCKVILIACNTASSNAYKEVSDYVGDRAIVINVIDPVIEHVTLSQKYKNVGIIGTKATIDSNTYPQKIKAQNSEINVTSLKTPLFVPMIEEGFIYDDISNAIIRSYLSKSELKNIDSLILGCTHYPIIKNQIKRYFNFSIDVIDSAISVAEKLREVLKKTNLLNNKKTHQQSIYVSDYTDYFMTIAKMFFESEVKLQKIDLWK